MAKSLQDRKAELQAELEKIEEQEAALYAKRDLIVGREVRVAIEKGDVDLSNRIKSLLDSSFEKEFGTGVIRIDEKIAAKRAQSTGLRG